MKVLLVEDNEMNRDMLSRRLSIEGFEVSVACDGEEGVSTAKASHPDLILMDLSLPVMDGWEATRRLKDDSGTADIPIIALTAHALESDRHKAMDAGCDDYASKPVDIHKLLRQMSRYVVGKENGKD